MIARAGGQRPPNACLRGKKDAARGLRVWSPTTLLTPPDVVWLLGADEARPTQRSMIASEGGGENGAFLYIGRSHEASETHPSFTSRAKNLVPRSAQSLIIVYPHRYHHARVCVFSRCGGSHGHVSRAEAAAARKIAATHARSPPPASRPLLPDCHRLPSRTTCTGTMAARAVSFSHRRLLHSC